MCDAAAVVPTADRNRAAALSLLFGHLPPNELDEQVEDLIAAESRGELSLAGLLSAEVDREIVGAILYLMQPDRCAYVWPPAIAASSGNPAAVADALLQELARRVRIERAWIAQCLADPHATQDRAALVRNGFKHLADLDYLSRRLADPLPPLADDLLDTISFRPRENRKRFAEVIERTYSGSLDCPGLDGIRTANDAIDSHSTTGVFMPEQWQIVRDDDRDVGVLIFADHPDQDAWELVYMGIVPEARGRGYGKIMLSNGLYDARASGRGSVLLAVDSRNEYARRVYDELGFRLLETRSIHALFPMPKTDNPQIVHSPPTRS